MKLSFHKMNGAGNDFVVIDNRSLDTNLNRQQIAQLCDRQRGVGADGLLAVEPAEAGADFKFRYYNADGGEAEMCGNGARCFGKYTAMLTGENTKHVTFETIAGTLSADIIGDNVRIAMSDPFDLALNADLQVDDLDSDIHIINTGVPHTVVFTEDLKKFDVLGLGAAIRYHDYFAPKGTNANFTTILSDQHIAIRTYERGVEGETLACGTGMTACALIHHLLNGAASPISVDVEGGETLEIGFIPGSNQSFTSVTLTGPADFVFQGIITI
ncbi:MAG: diaminopimelate epimerase [Akkermansiaceae bacterium]|nr:diaminopimelate epimerase [Akkermansiaceae bacterium]